MPARYIWIAAILFLYGQDSSFPYQRDPFESSLRRNGEFVKALTPLVPTSGTRGIDDSKWPYLAAMVKETGIDPADVYLLTEHTAMFNTTPELEKAATANAKHINDLLNCSPAGLIQALQHMPMAKRPSSRWRVIKGLKRNVLKSISLSALPISAFSTTRSI